MVSTNINSYSYVIVIIDLHCITFACDTHGRADVYFFLFAFLLLDFCLSLNIYRGIIFMGKPKKHQSSDAAADELNLETLKDEGELVSIATLKQMLDVQQSMLKTLFDSFISTVIARVDKLTDSVASLKASFEFTQKDVGDLSSLKSKLLGAEKDIVEIKNTVELQGNKIEY